MKSKIGMMFLVVMLALAGIGISYAGFTDELYIFGEVDTATVELEIIDYSGTDVYKIWDVTPDFDLKQEWVDSGIVDTYSPTEELLIFKGSKSLLPTESDVASYFDGNGYVDLVSWAYAEQGSNDDEINMVYHNMFPCVDFTADFIFKYTGSIPAKLWAEYEIIEDDSGLLAMLLDEGQITLEAIGSKGIFKDTDTPLQIGSQVHGGEEIYLALTIHVPQDNKYQGLSGSFTSSITALQWNEDYEEEGDGEGITLKASKIICESTDCLPEWGADQNQPVMITEEIINQFLTDHQDCCYKESEWEFEYGFDVDDPISNYDDITTQYGYGGNGWNPFTETMFIPLGSIPENSDNICIREVLEDGFIPFAGATTDPGDGSAELYAHTDGYNFDNLEWIPVNELVAGGTYYIVGFNVPIEQDCNEEIHLEKTVWNETSQHWEDSIIVDYGDTVSFNISIDLPEDACTTIDGNVTDKLPAGLAYIDDSTNITVIFSDDSVEYWEVEPLKETYGTSGVRLIWNETNMGGPMVLQPGTHLHITFDAEVTAITGAITNTAEIYAMYDEEDLTLRAEDTAFVEVYFEETFTEIWTIDDLYAIRNNPTGNYILMRNLNFWWAEEYYVEDGVGAEAKMIENTTGDGWLPIGDSSNPFTGIFDGQGYTISNLFIDRNDTDNVGLFGYIQVDAVVKHVGLIDVNITGQRYIGGLIGHNDGMVEFCYSTGLVTGENIQVGGLIGHNDGMVEFCYSTVLATGSKNQVGGLIGGNNGIVSNCSATGDINGGSYVGGLIGNNGGNSNVEFSYATGNVNGDFFVGGLIGLVGGSFNPIVESCYATGDTNGDSFVGGLIGSSQGTVENCFATGQVTGGHTVGGLIGSNTGDGTVQDSFYDQETTGQSDTGNGTPKTTDEMKDITTFTTWDIAYNDYINLNNGYPYLGWQIDDESSTWMIFNPPSSEIYTIEDLHAIRYHLTGDYILMNDLDFNDAGSWEDYPGNKDEILKTQNNFEEQIGSCDGVTTEFQISLYPLQSATITYGCNRYSIDPLDYSVDLTTGLVTFTEPPTYGCGWAPLYAEFETIDSHYFGWLAIGDNDNPFTGTLDGQNYTISNLFINRNSSFSDFVGFSHGLFGRASYAQISNLGLLNVDITGTSLACSLIGWGSSCTITNCYSTGTLTGNNNVGGLLGSMSNSVISKSYSTADVTGAGSVGGFIGSAASTDISTSYAAGSVTATDKAGGFIGYYSESEGGNRLIKDCYSTGSVTRNAGSGTHIGGFIGYTNWGNVTYSYSTGLVTVGDETDKGFGGGYVWQPTIPLGEANFFDTVTSNQLTSNWGNAEPKITTEMQTITTFSDIGWDIAEDDDWTNEIWKIDEGNDYPRLGWEL